MPRLPSWLGGPRDTDSCPHDPPTPASPTEPNPDHAWKTLALMNEWIRHSDAKAGVTLAFTGALATMTFNLAKDFEDRNLFFDALVLVVCLLLVVTGCLCGWTLTPRVKNKEVGQAGVNLLFFMSIEHSFRHKRRQYSDELRILTSDHTQLTRELADQIHANARIATVKSNTVAWAIRSALGVGVAVAALATIVGTASS